MADSEDPPPPPQHLDPIIRELTQEPPSRHGSLQRSGSPPSNEYMAPGPHQLGNERATTPVSITTFQANTLFQDFDGVHSVESKQSPARERDDGTSRYGRPTNPNDSQTSLEREHNSNLRYYPAPVPRVITLPQRLSRQPPAALRANRRSQALQSLLPPAGGEAEHSSDQDSQDEQPHLPGYRKSMARSRSSDGLSTADRMSRLPPQLRASEFFECPAVHQKVTVKDGSAAETLESILDASMHAPVNAFTDHPVAGSEAAVVYEKESNNRSRASLASKLTDARSTVYLQDSRSSQTLGQLDIHRKSVATPLGFCLDNNHSPGSRGSVKDEGEDGIPAGMGNGASTTDLGRPRDSRLLALDDDLATNWANEPGQDVQHPRIGRHSQPTTLLAELQLRKEHQRQRTKTAATAFPNGMQSTLLEMDAVAEEQKRARRRKHVTLAWEELQVNDGDANGDNDQDTSLGMLASRPSPRAQEKDVSSAAPPRLGTPDDGPANQVRRRSPIRGALHGNDPIYSRSSQSQYRLEVPGLEREHGPRSPARQEGLLSQSTSRLSLGDPAPPRPGHVSSAYFANDLLSRYGSEAFRSEGAQRRPPESETTVIEPRRKAPGPAPASASPWARYAPQQPGPPTSSGENDVRRYSHVGVLPAQQAPLGVPPSHPQHHRPRTSCIPPQQFPVMTSYARWRSTMGPGAFPSMAGPGGIPVGAPNFGSPGLAGSPSFYAQSPQWNQSSPQLNFNGRQGQQPPGLMNMPNQTVIGAPGMGFPTLQPPVAGQEMRHDMINQWRQHVQP